MTWPKFLPNKDQSYRESPNMTRMRFQVDVISSLLVTRSSIQSAVRRVTSKVPSTRYSRVAQLPKSSLSVICCLRARTREGAYQTLAIINLRTPTGSCLECRTSPHMTSKRATVRSPYEYEYKNKEAPSPGLVDYAKRGYRGGTAADRVRVCACVCKHKVDGSPGEAKLHVGAAFEFLPSRHERS